jgi:hypothetical protein
MASCEKILDVDNDPSAAQLVVNAVPQAGKRAFVYFAHTRFFLDPSNNQPLDDASVTLYVNGNPLSPDSVANCKYFFPYTCTEGDTLSLQASAAASSRHCSWVFGSPLSSTWAPSTMIAS